MEAKELRIGNNLYNDGVVVTIDARSIFDIWDDKGLKNYKPIPLTEEWLLKFGFEKKQGGLESVYFILAGKCLLEYNLTHKFADIVRKVNLDLFIELEYVHSLQNLYFALTGEELIVSLPQ